MFKVKKIAHAIALVGVTGGLMQTAWADDVSSATDQGNSQKSQKIEVVGTNIKRVSTETSSPVQVFKRDDIAKTGATTVTELLQNLPSAQNGNAAGSQLSDISGNGSFAPGASSISLRGLGENSTLVLLNGRRLPNFGLSNYQDQVVNLDGIPLAAVEQVQILKSGASAIYGSDAVAGVINIITRKDYDGLEVASSHQQSITSGQFGTSTANITAGHGDLDKDGYNILTSLDFYHRNAVMWTNLLGYVNKGVTSKYPDFGSNSTLSNSGNFIDADTGIPQAGTPCNAPDVLSGSFCKYPRYNDIQAVPSSDRQNLFVMGTFKINENLEAFGEITAGHLKTTYISQHYTYDSNNGVESWIVPSTGATLSFTQPYLSASSPLNPFGPIGDDAEFRYRFTDAPNTTTADASQYRVFGGLRGNTGKYDWESAVGMMGSRGVATTYGQMSLSGFLQEIGNPTGGLDGQGNYVTPDPTFFQKPGGYVIGGPNSAAVINTLFPAGVYTGVSKQEFWDGKISGAIMDLPAGTLSFATGAELRHESYSLNASQNLLSGDMIQNGIDTANAGRTYGALYGELSIPVLQKLEADLAARVDKYPNFAAHISPKLGLRFEASNSLLLRGTIETGFRAPNLLESANSQKFAYAPGISDPERCSEATAMSQALQNFAQNIFNNPNATPAQIALANQEYVRGTTAVSNECSGSVAEDNTYNPNLKPETSTSFSLGAVFEPVKGYSMSADYFNITRKNQINILGMQQILNQQALTGSAPSGTTIYRSPVGTQDPTFLNSDPAFGGASDFAMFGVNGVNQGPVKYVQDPFQNLGKQSTSGIDLNIKTKTGLGALGKLETELNATYTVSFKDDQVDPAYENLAGHYGYPRWVGNMNVSLTSGPMENTVRVNYQGPTSLAQSAGDGFDQGSCAQRGWTVQQCGVGSYTTYDYLFEFTGMKNATVQLGLQNIFAKKYPVDLRAVYSSAGEIPNYLQDAEGRMLRASLSYKFF